MVKCKLILFVRTVKSFLCALSEQSILFCVFCQNSQFFFSVLSEQSILFWILLEQSILFWILSEQSILFLDVIRIVNSFCILSEQSILLFLIKELTLLIIGQWLYSRLFLIFILLTINLLDIHDSWLWGSLLVAKSSTTTCSLTCA